MLQIQFLIEHQHVKAVDHGHEQRERQQLHAVALYQVQPGHAGVVRKGRKRKRCLRRGGGHTLRPSREPEHRRHERHTRQQPRPTRPAPGGQQRERHHRESGCGLQHQETIPLPVAHTETMAHLTENHRQADPRGEAVRHGDRKEARERRQAQGPEQPLKSETQGHREPAGREHLLRRHAQFAGGRGDRREDGREKQRHHGCRRVNDAGTIGQQRGQCTGNCRGPQRKRTQRQARA